MSRRTGTADLPLHSGHVPSWLFERMTRLGRVLAEAIVLEYGRDEFLRRLAHPFWFQSFGCVMGMDWHSSGITTSVLGALKRGLDPIAGEVGLYVCGGKGRHSRDTPAELLAVGERTGLPGGDLARASRLVAKVDTAAVQDGFDLYLHGFVVSAEGRWTAVQQGMNSASRTARRYHWLSEGLASFVEAPHTAIEGKAAGVIANLTDARAAQAREAQVALVEAGPDAIVDAVLRSRERRPARPRAAPTLFAEPESPHLAMPPRHDVRPSDISLTRLRGNIAAAAARGPRDFAELLQTPGVGARTVLALALAAEVIHGAPYRFQDPARFSLAHGGKDGHPFPVPLAVYDRTLAVLRRAVDHARLGNSDRLAAIRRLDQEARRLEHAARGLGADAFMRRERRLSAAYGGRTVWGGAPTGGES